MRITVLYRPRSEHARTVEEFAHDIERQQGVRLELLNIDTREGSAMASLYDITAYPAIFTTRDDGSVVQVWMGEQMPLMNEVAASVRS